MNFKEYLTGYLKKRDSDIVELEKNLKKLKKDIWILDHKNHFFPNPSCPSCIDKYNRNYNNKTVSICAICTEIFSHVLVEVRCNSCGLNICESCMIQYEYTDTRELSLGHLCINCFNSQDTVICSDCRHLLSDNSGDADMYCIETFGICEECNKIYCIGCAGIKTYENVEHNLCINCNEYHYWCPSGHGHDTKRKNSENCEKHSDLEMSRIRIKL